MENSILIKNAKLIAQMDDKRTRIQGGCIYVEGPEIKFVGKKLPKGLKIAAGTRTIDASGCVVLPGFVNTHHHLYQTLFRNIREVQDVELFDWLTFLYTRWANITPDGVYTSALVGLGELLLTGCTTSTDQFYVFPKKQPKNLLDYEIKAAADIGIRFHPTRGSMSRGKSKGGLPPDEVVQTEDEIMRDSERVIDAYHDTGKFAMCRIGLSPCSPFSVTTELLKETVKLARARKVRCHTHIAETKDEEDFCLQLHKLRPVPYMEKVGWLGNDVWFAHCIYLNDREIKLMGETKTGVAHCPVSNLRLGSGIAPVRKMIENGVPVGLAVDGSASNDSSNMLKELKTCLLVHRIKSGIKSMPAEDVFWIATRGGAEILGRDDIGSIEAGKAADIVMFDVEKIGYAGGMHDPLAAVLFCGDSDIVDTTIVNGKVVVEDGRLVNIDEQKLYVKANKIAAKMVNG
jgi:cytosine/adenosine deaminase-related metal-dependent hydrolase